MTELLTPADVARLLADPSAQMREELAGKLAPILRSERLNEAELALAQDIVRRLALDVEMTVRRTLAHSLRTSPQLPHDVALRMAQDVEAVALPILSESVVLTDEDLVEIVLAGSTRKQVVIANRPGLTSVVSDTIASMAAEEAVVALMGNRTAEISEHGLSTAIDRFPASRAVTETMAQRSVLPMTVAERLVVLVSDRLRDHLVRNHALSPTTASDIVLRGREKAIIQLSAGAGAADLQRMVQQMHHAGRLTHALVLRALCTGDIAFFEAAMAVRAEIPLLNAQTLIHDPGGLVSLCRRVEIPDRMIPVIRAAVAAVDDARFDGQPRDLERYQGRVLARILTEVDTMDFGDASYLVDRLAGVLV